MENKKGFSLIELIVAMSVFGVLLHYAVPRFRNAFEQARVNLAAANLQAVWTAQRLYWAENGAFSSDLTTLSDAGLLDPAFITMAANPDARFAFGIDSSSSTTFSASAARQNSTSWSGSVSIDQDGIVTGSVDNADGTSIEPATTF